MDLGWADGQNTSLGSKLETFKALYVFISWSLEDLEDASVFFDSEGCATAPMIGILEEVPFCCIGPD